MNHSFELLKQAEKDFSHLMKNNKKALLLLLKTVQNLQNLNLDKALESHTVKALVWH